ncbi:MAG TPA: BTAD domain-containing putative transcriptional regulator [Glycomyces sp.]|nr:BTAD domain-containing putative transcriptional regulator [Glycomyces sp.]
MPLIRVLGPIELTDGPDRVGLGPPRQRAVFAVLAVAAGRPVGTESLIARVWGERPPANVRSSLYGYASRLRARLRAVDPGVALRRAHSGYLLDVDHGRVDLHAARSLAARGRASAGADAAATLREAAALWSPDPLSGLAGDWADRLRASLLEERAALLTDLFGTELRLGRHDAVLGPLAAATAEHPLHENLIRLRMIALHGAGDHAAALAVYAEARQRIAADLGVEPGHGLRDLHARLLRGDLPLPEPRTAAPRQLPGDVARFTGRERELGALQAELADAADGGPAPVPVAVVSGPPGTGKTALAVHLAHRVAHRFPDGQLFVDLRGHAPATALGPLEVLSGALRALGVTPERVPDRLHEAVALYRTTLADRRALIVLDNAADAAQVAPLLPGGRHCAVLVTSRHRLGTLVAHHGARPLVLGVLDEADAVTLLRDFVGHERLPPAVAAELARLCGRLPLALRISAANLADDPDRSAADYVASLAAGDRFWSLSAEAGGDTVGGALDQSYAAVGTDARALFRLLGLAPGADLTAPAAAALADLPPDRAAAALERLCAAHLLVRHGDRYRLHDLLRRYAAAKSDDHDGPAERRAALERLCDWYLGMADAARTVLYPKFTTLPRRTAIVPPPFDAEGPAHDWLATELPNLIAVARHAAEHGPRRVAWSLADSLRGHLWGEGGIEGAEFGRAGLAAAEAESDPAGQAAAHLSQCLFHARRGEHYDLAIEHGRLAKDFAALADWPEGTVAACNNLAIASARAGRLRHAAGFAADGLAAAEALGQDGARELTALGVVHYELGELRASMSYMRRAVTAARRSDRVGLSGLLANLAEVCVAAGRPDWARGHADEALALIAGREYRRRDATVLRIAAAVYHASGRLERALDLARTASRLADRGADPRARAYAANTLAAVLGALGQTDAAVVHYESAVASAGEKEGWPQANALLGLAALHAERGERTAARAAAARARDLAAAMEYAVVEHRARSLLEGLESP